MRLPGKKLVQNGLRRARSRLLGGIPILGYHRLDDRHDPFGLDVSARHFAEHVDVLARRMRPMRLPEAVDAATRGAIPPKAVVVTFDDGYRDTFDTALPLLHAAGVPATVFVSSGYLGREFWWDELTRIFARTADLPQGTFEICGRTYAWPARSTHPHDARADEPARGTVLTAVANQLRPMRSFERNAAMCAVRTWASCRAGEPDGPRGLTHEELRQLAASPCIDIGAHTVSHPVLPTLPVSEQRQEVLESREHLQQITGRMVTSFSYPHGSYSAETLAVVREAGFTSACCSTPDVLTPHFDRFAIPRLWVTDQDGAGFERWLGTWLAA